MTFLDRGIPVGIGVGGFGSLGALISRRDWRHVTGHWRPRCSTATAYPISAAPSFNRDTPVWGARHPDYFVRCLELFRLIAFHEAPSAMLHPRGAISFTVASFLWWPAGRLRNAREMELLAVRDLAIDQNGQYFSTEPPWLGREG
jgi:hypothetical protein